VKVAQEPVPQRHQISIKLMLNGANSLQKDSSNGDLDDSNENRESSVEEENSLSSLPYAAE
jgi:hypothetical protein